MVILLKKNKKTKKSIKRGTQDLMERRTYKGVVYLETNVDRLFHLVERKKEIKIDDAARILNIREGKIEGWGKILESHNLVKLHYPPFGKAVLIVKKLERRGKVIKEEKKIKKEMKKYKRGGKSKKIAAVIAVLILVAIVYNFFIDNQFFNRILFLLTSTVNYLINVLTNNQFYLLLLPIIIIVIVVLMILKYKWEKVKFWWWKLRMSR